jgi:diaminohydroxyphosphoribosylaminopyrimidine deaminase / 5-amino-6-(5-phosphoribosylamino)uracil reductase
MASVIDDNHFMRLALALARQSRPSPNPRVGAVIVQQNRIVGKGFHRAPGHPHAEIEALKDAADAGENVGDATIYVTLEPCCHQGKTGPCSVALHQAGIGRIVVGMADPDPLVGGNGIASLRKAGHQVDVGVLEDECKQLLHSYIHHRTQGRPLVHLKAATTMDGYIATVTGDSRWITGPSARAYGHELRAAHDAVLVGSGTVLADNPTLTVRDAEGASPVRVILDSHLKLPMESNLLKTTSEGKVIILHGADIPSAKASELARISNLQLIGCQPANSRLDITDIVQKLNSLGFLSVLVEGGSQLHGAFIQARLADRLSLFIAPKIIGSGIPWASIPGIASIKDAITLNPDSIRTTQLDQDALIEGDFFWDENF